MIKQHIRHSEGGALSYVYFTGTCHDIMKSNQRRLFKTLITLILDTSIKLGNAHVWFSVDCDSCLEAEKTVVKVAKAMYLHNVTIQPHNDSCVFSK